jgi:hypothetical protein
MSRHNEARREADAESYHPGSYLGRNADAAVYMHILLVQHCQGNVLQGNIQYSITPAARQVTECLNGYDPGKRLVEKVDNSDYYMSGC